MNWRGLGAMGLVVAMAACAPSSGEETRAKAGTVGMTTVQKDYKTTYGIILNAATYCIDDSKAPASETAARILLTGLGAATVRQTVDGTLDENNKIGRIAIMLRNQLTGNEAHLANIEVKDTPPGPRATISTYTKAQGDNTHSVIMAWYNGARNCPNNSYRTIGEPAAAATPAATTPAGPPRRPGDRPTN